LVEVDAAGLLAVDVDADGTSEARFDAVVDVPKFDLSPVGTRLPPTADEAAEPVAVPPALRVEEAAAVPLPVAIFDGGFVAVGFPV
jgi:hypothetical protein